MRLTLRTMLAIACAMSASACSSLGGVELQDGAEGRFTAGDDGDPTDPDADSSPGHPAASDSGDGTSDADDHDMPLEPPPSTEDTGEASTTGDLEGETDDAHGTDGTASASATDPNESGDDETGDDGTTSLDPQTNGIESASASVGETGQTEESGDCIELDCVPACDPTWACDAPCDGVREGTACVTDGGIVVTCDMGLWTCASD